MLVGARSKFLSWKMPHHQNLSRAWDLTSLFLLAASTCVRVLSNSIPLGLLSSHFIDGETKAQKWVWLSPASKGHCLLFRKLLSWFR